MTKTIFSSRINKVRFFFFYLKFFNRNLYTRVAWNFFRKKECWILKRNENGNKLFWSLYVHTIARKKNIGEIIFRNNIDDLRRWCVITTLNDNLQVHKYYITSFESNELFPLLLTRVYNNTNIYIFIFPPSIYFQINSVREYIKISITKNIL